MDVVIEDDIPDIVLLDHRRIQQVVTSLISNAIKFSLHDGSGRVSVAVGTVTSEDLASSGDTWWYEVCS